MKENEVRIPVPKFTAKNASQALEEADLRDRILGALVGSAIGDAMGASTEMWDRKEIQQVHGYITGLLPVLREKSPEGVWQHNMPAGSTTDDTRWKILLADYISQEEEWNADNFYGFIAQYYKSLVAGLGSEQSMTSPQHMEGRLQQVAWIQEWAKVALADSASQEDLGVAKNRFYGGEMSCAGMLYSQVFGLLASGAEEAYHKAYEHAVFDIGYARDLSSLTAVMTHFAMHLQNIDDVLNASMLVDPHQYADSRLLGRIARDLFDDARMMAGEHSDTASNEQLLGFPSGFPGSMEDWERQSATYERLAVKQKAVAFHAGEIWQILIAGLEFGAGDFMQTLQFIVNYGRDNDTVAAIAGMILGAHLGFDALPAEIRDEVVRVSQEVMGLDLEKAADKLCAKAVNTA